MATIALVYSPLGGHSGPIRRLGGTLVRQGHRVVELPFGTEPREVPADAATHGPVIPARPMFDPLRDPLEIALLLAERTSVMVEYMAEQLLAAGVDLIVYDVVAPWGRVAADWLGVPKINSHPTFPGGITELRVPEGSQVSPKVREQTDRLHRARDEVARRWGVDLGGWVEILTNRGDYQVLYTTPEILGHAELPDSYRFVGPLMAPMPDATEPLLDGWGDEPLVYVAMGTMFTSNRDVFAAALEALADLPVRTLVSTWGRFTEADFDSLPANARVVAQVNSRAVLRHATLHITHGGANSMHESLIEGVPMLCLPQAHDQRAWAQAVAAARGAEVLADHSAGAIRDAVVRLVEDGALRARVGELGRSVAAYDGDEVLSGIIDELLAGARTR